jgi:hypothetical protein
METAKPRTFAATMVALFALYDREATDELMDLYRDALDGLTPEQLQQGVSRAIRELKWLPKPAEIRELAGISGPRVLARQIADAWEAVCKAMRQHDYTTSVDFGPLVNAVLRNMGGWSGDTGACHWTIAEIETWKRKEFERLYEAFAAGDQSALRGEPLAGAFAGPVVRVAIAGVVPPARRLESVERAPVSDLARELADGHSLQGAPRAGKAPDPSIATDRAAERKARREADDARAAEAVARLAERVAAGKTEAA